MRSDIYPHFCNGTARRRFRLPCTANGDLMRQMCEFDSVRTILSVQYRFLTGYDDPPTMTGAPEPLLKLHKQHSEYGGIFHR